MFKLQYLSKGGDISVKLGIKLFDQSTDQTHPNTCDRMITHEYMKNEIYLVCSLE